MTAPGGHSRRVCRPPACLRALQSFKVEFEVNVIVVFEDHYMVTENFPITLYRA